MSVLFSLICSHKTIQLAIKTCHYFTITWAYVDQFKFLPSGIQKSSTKCTLFYILLFCNFVTLSLFYCTNPAGMAAILH